VTATGDTIYALSSGRPPAAIAVVRISGPDAGAGLRRMTVMPTPRRASASILRHPVTRDILDEALVLWMPGPASATCEDVVELHLHGGRAVVDAVLGVLGSLPGYRHALPGEFTRRAFENGRIDLNEAEGLADLLAAETDGQRRNALLAAGGVFSRQVETWRVRLLGIAASVEAAIDFSDEAEVTAYDATEPTRAARRLADDIEQALRSPSAERLKDGIRVVVAGPPNVGKSSLINALCRREAAIESPIAGTTRDIIEVPIQISGVPLILMDTAGLRDTNDDVEREGIVRAERAFAAADIVLWLGEAEAPNHDQLIGISPQADRFPVLDGRLPVSSRTGLNLDVLTQDIVQRAAKHLPREGTLALNRRQRSSARELQRSLIAAADLSDLVLLAEELRTALSICERISGRSGVEDMLDALFGSFCLGK